MYPRSSFAYLVKKFPLFYITWPSTAAVTMCRTYRSLLQMAHVFLLFFPVFHSFPPWIEPSHYRADFDPESGPGTVRNFAFSGGTKFSFGGDPLGQCQCVGVWENYVCIVLFSWNHAGFFMCVYSVTVLKWILISWGIVWLNYFVVYVSLILESFLPRRYPQSGRFIAFPFSFQYPLEEISCSFQYSRYNFLPNISFIINCIAWIWFSWPKYVLITPILRKR